MKQNIQVMLNSRLIFMTLQIYAALQGTMVMELQPISSCKPEDIENDECALTVSNKVSGIYN